MGLKLLPNNYLPLSITYQGMKFILCYKNSIAVETRKHLFGKINNQFITFVSQNGIQK